MFHADRLKLFEAIQGTADQLRSMVREACPDIAVKLSEADVDFFPMIVQNWMVDIFINVLPTDAAARVWGHIILDNAPGLPLKFSLKLLTPRRLCVAGAALGDSHCAEQPETYPEILAGGPQ